jgi:hypothetical protein
MHITCRVSALSLLVCLAAGCGGSSSDSGSSGPTGVTYSAALNGTQEVPVVVTAATGTAQFTHHADMDTIDVTITISNIAIANITGFHIHVGGAGINGPVVVDLGNQGLVFSDIGNGMAQVQGMGVPFPDAHEGSLSMGECYLNVHTSAQAAGEIRGQILPTP